MKRNIRIASLIMFASLLGLLSFQVYWISSAYSQKKSNLESEIKEAFSRANNGLLIKKLGDFSGINVSVNATGDFFSADTLFLKRKDFSFSDERGMITHNGHGFGKGREYHIDTIISDINEVFGEMTTQVEAQVFVSEGGISNTDFEFLDSLLKVYLLPIDFENQYELTFGDLGEEMQEFSGGGYKVLASGAKVKTFVQPLSFASGDKMARVILPEKQLVRASLSSISLIILASLLMLVLLVSAWYYIIRSLQRQYELTQMKDDFISNMTHELKTPVTASSLALEVISKNDKVKNDDGLINLIGVAQSEQQRMLSMIDTILDSTTEKGLANEALEVLSLNEELEAVSDTIRLKASESGGSLSLQLPARELFVKASQVHLQNAIINILENALRYTEEAPEIIVKLTEEEAMVQLAISDNGLGISKEDQKRIFEKFFRVSTGNVHTVKGYGLGLSYTKAVIERVGGSISLESEPGAGTTFTIKLPMTDAG